MNTFKRKALFTAVLAGLGAAGTAEAVYLNPNHTGQVLIYPYYTVQSTNGNSWNTLISVVNTTTRAKAVKVRVLEGKTSAEVLDFNLFLSPNDVWTAAIVPADSTATSAGRMVTADVSCTAPAFPAGGQDFRNYQYVSTSNGANLPGTGLDRTREGYIEMLEMGVLAGTWATAVTHVNGVPANCAFVQVASATPTAGVDIFPPQGGLMGTGTLMNVNNGQDAGYKADALEAWSNTAQYSVPTLTFPNLSNANPATSLVVNAGGIDPATQASMLATAYLTTFTAVSGVPAGARAVASVYMHTNVMNEFILDTATRSNTDWVITQPLKNLFVNNVTAATPYTNVLTSAGACETIGFTYFDREERTATANPGDFSPPPPAGAPNSLCWESNVLSIRNGASHMPTGNVSGVLGSVNVTAVAVLSNFQNGWANLSFAGANAAASGGVGMAGAGAGSQRVSLNSTLAPAATVATGAVTFFGLPVTGFMVRNFANGNLTCGTGTCQGNYGSLFAHSYLNTITP